MFCSGGMPSSHTAATIALTTMVGFLDGFGSTLFAVCLIFSIVVMYDAAGVRRQAGKQGSIINMLLNFDFFKDPSMQFTEIKEKSVIHLLKLSWEPLQGYCVQCYFKLYDFSL